MAAVIALHASADSLRSYSRTPTNFLHVIFCPYMFCNCRHLAHFPASRLFPPGFQSATMPRPFAPFSSLGVLF
jgi:hypothetical protein